VRFIMAEQPLRYFLLDRDGVVSRRSCRGHAECWDKFEFLPRALEALRLLAEHHYAGIIISHQPRKCEAAASENELDTITRRLLLEVALSGGHIVRAYYCRHRIEDACDCYYPDTGLIARAKAEYGFPLEKSYFVSAGELDLQAASEAGCPCIRIQRDAFLQERGSQEEPYRVASNLYEAAEQILASTPAFEQVYETVQA
jgi:D-glycero-D-manno-heptose 1,7-bisphosphate phosphatase